ncbi:penicillin-binding protein, partial [Patescibacteria group bacterium]|nr:penicillin-binding protein [Patescibacteria group bacterium]
MATRPQDALNEKLAPTLVKEVLKLISGLLLLFGKPLFIVFFLIFFFISQITNITGYLLEGLFWVFRKINFFKNYLKIRKKSGVVFSASREQLKVRLEDFQKNIHEFHKRQNKKLKKNFNKLNDFFWKTEVFLIALEKISTRIFVYLKRRPQIRKTTRVKYSRLKSVILTNTRIFLLKQKLFILPIRITFPGIKIPRISWLKIITFLFAFTFLTSLIAGFLFWRYILKDLPTPEKLLSRKQPVSTKIYDRNGVLLYNIFKDQNRTPVKLSDIPIHVRLATIAIEDSEFYSHPGFSVKGIVRAFIKNYKEKKLTGGSTITQQLVKNALLTPEKTLIRKLKELTLAIKVELTFNKDEILEMYLNEVGYGGTAYGVQEAARTYFGKDVGDLNLTEASFIAGLPKSPTEFSPFGTNPSLAFSRQKEVLNLMEANGFITSEQKTAAEKEEIKFADQKTDIKAPHFIMYVRQLLEEKYGKELIESGGLEITTTLDYQIQTLAEKIVKEEVEKLASLNVTNAAAVILNPKTGEILAMVGSRDYFDTENDGNVNVTIRPRQPGSSIKVVNYAYALSNGINLATIIPDKPVTFLVEGQPPYTPRNYEGGFRGNLTLRSAFAESRNIPAVRVLSSYGVDKMVEMGQKMGITTWQDPDNYGLSLTLGGGEVKLLDLARVYSTIANYGKRPELVSVLTVKDLTGSLHEKFKCELQEDSLVAYVSASSSASNNENVENCKGEQVLDPRVAFLITDILKDNNARSPTFGSNSL